MLSSFHIIKADTRIMYDHLNNFFVKNIIQLSRGISCAILFICSLFKIAHTNKFCRTIKR